MRTNGLRGVSRRLARCITTKRDKRAAPGCNSGHAAGRIAGYVIGAYGSAWSSSCARAHTTLPRDTQDNLERVIPLGQRLSTAAPKAPLLARLFNRCSDLCSTPQRLIHSA